MNDLQTQATPNKRTPRIARFGIASLFTLMAIFAFAAWLFSMGYVLAPCLWLGLIAGIVLGLESRYPISFMGIFGVVMGGLYAAAIAGTTTIQHFYTSSAFEYIAARSKTIGGDMRMVLICLVIALWVMAFLMTCWLVSLLFRQATRATTATTGQTAKTPSADSSPSILNETLELIRHHDDFKEHGLED
ncbi:MAG: hypothetical protein ACI814_004812 [Mariniblastus sp.]|jgi:hypothetical protein